MASGTVRARFAALYAGAFLLTGAVVLLVAFAAGRETQHAGSPPGPVVITHPVRNDTLVIVLSVAALVVLSVGFGWLLAGRLLRPVRTITAAARDISASNLSRRLGTGGRDDEFARLGHTLNDLFARLEASFEAQRHFIANASHELRTPLAAERTVLQVALADPQASEASLRAACEQVLSLGTRQERLIDALLTLASSERGIEQAEPFDLADIAARVADSTGMQTRLGPAAAAGDPRLAESLVANLVSNALRHNLPGGWAEIETGAVVDGRAFVRVANTGPVIPPDQVDRLFRPFQRLGDSRSRHEDGHGLGLAIVGAIAAAHGAALSARPRPAGGLDIEVRFPPVSLPKII